MLQTCPACGSENRDTAKFCDQCGAALSPDVLTDNLPAPPAPDVIAAAGAGPARTLQPAPRGSGVNYSALSFLVVLALAIYLVIRPHPEAAPAAPPMMGGGTAATGAAGDNPMGTFANVQQQLKDLNSKLDKDPLDVDALTQLYSLYAQIGQSAKMKPYVDKALEAWKKKYPNSDENARKVLAGVALAALQSNDLDSAAQTLLVYHEAEPENIGVDATLGNIYYELDRQNDAIKYYDLYLNKATPATQHGDYWNVLVDEATMYLHRANGDVKGADFAKAMQILERATAQSPKLWAAWFNLGQAYKTAGDKPKALDAFKKAEKVADDDDRRWQAQNEIALLEGKAPPPRPENPHEGMDLPKPAPGTPNPHTGLGMSTEEPTGK